MEVVSLHDLKTQGMCKQAVRIDPWILYDVPDHLKTQEMCNEVIKKSTMAAVRCARSFYGPGNAYDGYHIPPEIYSSRPS